jgi:hypothetical protein
MRGNFDQELQNGSTAANEAEAKLTLYLKAFAVEGYLTV